MPRPFIRDLAFLSNYHHAPLEWEGQQYPTLEHAYQAAKTLDPLERQRIADAPKPGKAKRLGRKLSLRADWERVKLDIMLELLRLKFSSRALAALLLATGDEELAELNHWHDTFWGVCVGCHRGCEGVGENHLGRLLMQLRDELRAG